MTEVQRSWKQGFWIGFLAAAVIMIGAAHMREAGHAVALRAQQDTSTLWKDSSAVHRRAALHYRAQLAAANDRVHELLPRATAAVAGVRQSTRAVAVVAVAPVAAADSGNGVGFMVPFRDTTQLAGIQRPGVDSLPWLVPAFFVAGWQMAVSTVFVLDTVIQAQREQHRRAMLVIAAQDNRQRADSNWIRSLTAENAILQDSRQRCGRKCGIVIGVTATAATVYFASTLLEASAGGRTPGLRVSLRLGSL